jgi:hypothetical protein
MKKAPTRSASLGQLAERLVAVLNVVAVVVVVDVDRRVRRVVAAGPDPLATVPVPATRDPDVTVLGRIVLDDDLRANANIVVALADDRAVVDNRAAIVEADGRGL